jgi:stearoyl-CoA desaturase (delta-9 desaturase)
MTLLEDRAPVRGPKPVFEGTKRPGEQVALYAFVVIPIVAFLAAIPVAWGWGLNGTDVALLVIFYCVGTLGITVGFHRLFTHNSFKAKPWLRTVLALAGSLAIEGPVIRWVADHRRHHAHSDRDGDPHTPWRYGESSGALAKGFWHAHIGWLFDDEHTNREKYAPDLMADRPIRFISDYFGLWVVVSVGLPPLIGYLVSGTVTGAVTAFFWGTLVRVFLIHHVTWSINSICHTVGKRPFASRDKSTNVAALAILSFGESWHNMHHADPTAARHGTLPGQVDISARIIWGFEKLGWATDVRWPKPERLARLRAS